MTSTIETGHAKNVANFKQLLSAVTGFGAAYNPSPADLKLPALQTRSTQAAQALTKYNEAAAPFKTAVNSRQEGIEKMSGLVTRISGMMKSISVNSKVSEDTAGIIKKIRGQRATSVKALPVTEPVTSEEIKKISSSQVSFDQRKNNFERLVSVLSAVPSYLPNEADLKLDALKAYLTSLETINNTLNTAAVNLTNARAARDQQLYAPQTGLVDTAKRVKEYVKAAFGTKSSQYLQIKGIEFKTVKK